MDTITLDVQPRDKSLKVKDLRRQNLIPLEYYGKGVENMSLQVDYQTFRRAFRKAGQNTILDVNVDGAKEPISVLVHDVHFDPVTDVIKHVDLVNVRMGEKLHTKIPLVFTGTAPAVKEEGGILMQHITEIDVECLPRDLVHEIEVPLESLVDFHTYVRVKDLQVPETLTLLHEEEDVVANVVAPRVEAEPVEGEAAEGEAAAEGGDAPAEGGEAAAEGGE